MSALTTQRMGKIVSRLMRRREFPISVTFFTPTSKTDDGFCVGLNDAVSLTHVSFTWHTFILDTRKLLGTNSLSRIIRTK